MKAVSRYVQHQINRIIEDKHPVGIYITLEIFSSKDDTVNIQPLIIDKLEIHQDFLNNFMDEILCCVKFTPKDLYFMVSNLESLKCRVTFKFADLKTGVIDYNIPYIIKTYNLHFPNIEDVHKVVPDSTFIQDNVYLEEQHGSSIPVVVQLIPSKEYVLRKKRLNIMFQRSSIKDIILYICKSYGLENVYYEKEFINNLIYQNMYIPVEYGKIDTIFDYIHKRYGIYPHGMTFYYYNDIFYLYQPFLVDFTPEEVKLPVIKIIKLPPKSYLGVLSTYSYIDNNLHIMCNENVKTHSLNISTIENDGNLDIYFKSDMIFRNRVVNGDEISILNNIDNVGIGDDIQRIDTQSLNIRYSQPSINKLLKLSEISEKTTEIVVFNWKYSKPFSILPGSFTQFIYEKNNQPVYQPGRIEGIKYILIRHPQQLSNTNIFTCDSAVQLRLKTTFSNI